MSPFRWQPSSSDDHGCAFPLGCGFCGSPKRVGQGGQPLPSPPPPGRTHTGTPSLSKRRRPRRDGFTQEGRGGSVVAKAGMHCPVFWTPRAATEGLAGAEKGREEARTRRSIGRSLAGPSTRASLGLSRSPDRVLRLFPVHISWLPRSCSSTPCYRHEPGTESPSNRSHDVHGAQA